MKYIDNFVAISWKLLSLILLIYKVHMLKFVRNVIQDKLIFYLKMRIPKVYILTIPILT